MSSPVIPPRPQRAQPGPIAVPQNTPQIPPRPTRKHDPSPIRDMARSPLNDLPPTAMSNGGHAFYGQSNLSASELPRRPPSVADLPSIGQEGSEYASYDQLPTEAHGVKLSDSSPAQTRHADIPMHAPTASVPSSTAKSRISAVTRTDSDAATSAGFGKAEEGEPLGRSVSREQLYGLRTKNRSTQSLHGTPRPPSVHSVGEHEHGIPMIGTHVPMYPNAGDVQAPSPAPHQSTFPAGVGFFNDGSTRAHQRRRSSRQEFGPPGSYGLHGHSGQEPSDQFEREWIAKHPDMAAREGYGAGLPRPASALTSEQLNRLVREGDDVGFGTRKDMVGTPDQEIGYLASEEYASRLSSAKPSPISGNEPRNRSSIGAQLVPDSPLRQSSYPFNKVDHAHDSEDDVIHVDPPEIRKNKVTGGGEADGAIDLGPNAGNTSEKGGWFDERGDGVPILASDEILKRPGSAYLQPAVNPEYHRDDDDLPASRRGSMHQHGSRPSSRPGSTHGHHAFGGPLARFTSHDEHHGSGVGTPLEEIEEYEPLFPEDDAKNMSKALKEKLKQQRPNLAAHHFPSQDTWEDTPDSLRFTTNVETPEPEHQVKAAAVFETPEQEQARRDQNPAGMTSDAKTFVKPHFKAGVQHDLHRPGIQRFPSSDVWEDTPDSSRLETTVNAAQDDESSAPEIAADDELLPLAQTRSHQQILSRPQSRSKLSQDITQEIEEQSDSRARDVPDVGARSKPIIPARPARFSHSAEQADASPPLKQKPAVPARPAGNKLAGLRANFMNDLNSRLQLGPQAPPKPVESENDSAEEKAPLADARKGRAKGPARRKPAAPPANESFGFSFSSVTLWHIDEEDELKIGDDKVEKTESAAKESVKETAPSKAEPEPGFSMQQIGHEGDVPAPTVSAQAVSEAQAIQPVLAEALAKAEPAPVSAEALHEKDAAVRAAESTAAKTVSAVGELDLPAASSGGVEIRDGEEVGRTD